jgi:N-acetylneuraminic acid mutarotase
MHRTATNLGLAIVCGLGMAVGANADDFGCERNHYILNPKSWAAAAHLGIARSGHTATLLANGKVLVEGGDAFTESVSDHTIIFSGSTAELYDPATGTWTPTGSPVVQRLGHSAALVPGGKVLVVGGDVELESPWGGYRQGGSAELYDPQTGTWSPTGALHTPRGGFALTPLANGSVLVAGGYDDWDNTLNSTEIYDPVTGQWSYGANLVMARMMPTATLLEDGRVLVVGGWTDDTLLLAMSSAELYDPVSGQWTSTAPMGEARINHTATRLADGTVLVAGGYHANPPGGFGRYVPITLNEAEVFDPAAERWRTVGNLAGARQWHTATLLNDGTVLVAGGVGTNTSADVLPEERYDPVSATWSAAGTSTVGASGHTATLLRDGTVLVAGGNFVSAYMPVDTVERFADSACQ